VVGVGILLLLVAVVLKLQNVGGGDGLGLISADASSSYLGVGLLVFLDAVVPVFPGETTLNAASTLAAHGTLHLWLVILAGSVGAIAGDSALYWVSRRFSKRFQKQVERAKRNDKVATALGFLGDSAPLLLTAGRFVPGSSSTRRSAWRSTPTRGSSSGRRSEAFCGAPKPACSHTPSVPRWTTSHSGRRSSRGSSRPR
jgi:uncharacterized membrane protein YdjX (TVP38/TMEM64 family)